VALTVKNRKPAFPKEDEWLAELPEFEPDRSHELFAKGDGSFALFEPAREKKIKARLRKVVEPYARLGKLTGEFAGKHTGIEPFLNHAMKAIALYESRRSRKADYNRKKIECQLKDAHAQLKKLLTTFDQLNQTREIEDYLRSLFVAGADFESSFQLNDGFSAFSPSAISLKLFKLEPVILTAIKKITHKPGDFQRNKLLQEFVEALAFAWVLATGQAPTVSKANSRSKSVSPFIELLNVVNELLPKAIRHDANFSHHAVAAQKRLLAKIPELKIRRQPPRRP
jgi:hypothetical protein